MGTALGVEAGVGKYETLDGAGVEKVLVDDLGHIFDVDEAVPDGVGIDDDNGAMFALVEAGELIGADLSLEASVFHGFFERFL